MDTLSKWLLPLVEGSPLSREDAIKFLLACSNQSMGGANSLGCSEDWRSTEEGRGEGDAVRSDSKCRCRPSGPQYCNQ